MTDGYQLCRVGENYWHFEKNEINDGEAHPRHYHQFGPSDVFINSSQIQLVGLFVRRVSLSSPLHLSSANSLPLSSAVVCLILLAPKERNGHLPEKKFLRSLTSEDNTNVYYAKRLISHRSQLLLHTRLGGSDWKCSRFLHWMC